MVEEFALSDLPGNGSDRPAQDRGQLAVDDRVLVKLAEQASADVGGTVRHKSGLGTSALGTSALASIAGHRYPTASVSRLGGRAWVELDVAAAWPCDASDVGQRTQQTVRTQLQQLSGLSIERLDVTVHLVSIEDRQEVAVQ